MSSLLQQNSANLQEILNTINALPEAGTDLPELSNEGVADDLVIGKELISSNGDIVTGINPYAKAETDAEVATQTELLAQAVSALEEKAGVNSEAVFEAGRKAEYEENWNGLKNATYLTFCFAGYYWTDYTFKPPFDLKPSGLASGMFRTNRITNLKQRLIDAGVTLDTSKVTQAGSMFAYSSKLTVVPKLDLSAATTYAEIFNGTTALTTVEEIKFSAKGTFSNSFKGCTNLTNMNVTGVIGQNGFNVGDCTLLTHDSLMSIINCLETKTSGTWTVTLGTTNLAKLTDAEKAIATQKGWTLA